MAYSAKMDWLDKFVLIAIVYISHLWLSTYNTATDITEEFDIFTNYIVDESIKYNISTSYIYVIHNF